MVRLRATVFQDIVLNTINVLVWKYFRRSAMSLIENFQILMNATQIMADVVGNV